MLWNSTKLDFKSFSSCRFSKWKYVAFLLSYSWKSLPEKNLGWGTGSIIDLEALDGNGYIMFSSNFSFSIHKNPLDSDDNTFKENERIIPNHGTHLPWWWFLQRSLWSWRSKKSLGYRCHHFAPTHLHRQLSNHWRWIHHCASPTPLPSRHEIRDAWTCRALSGIAWRSAFHPPMLGTPHSVHRQRPMTAVAKKPPPCWSQAMDNRRLACALLSRDCVGMTMTDYS